MIGWVPSPMRDPYTGRFISAKPTRFRYQFKGALVEGWINTAGVRTMVMKHNFELSRRLCEESVKQAKLRVRPGVGPGPHPHRTDHGWIWEDTGNLADAITFAFETLPGDQVRDQVSAMVYVDATKAPYGIWLERGFHGPSGKFYRYQFLLPACQNASRNFTRYVNILGTLPTISSYSGKG